MALVAPLPAMNNSVYGASNNNSEERETGSGFEVGPYFISTVKILYGVFNTDMPLVYTSETMASPTVARAGRLSSVLSETSDSEPRFES